MAEIQKVLSRINPDTTMGARPLALLPALVDPRVAPASWWAVRVGQKLVRSAMHQMQMNTGASHRIPKLARPIADLEDSNQIETPHLAQADSIARLFLSLQLD